MTSELGQSQGFWGAEPGAYSPHSPLSVTQSPVSLFLLCLVRAFKEKTASSCEQPAWVMPAHPLRWLSPTRTASHGQRSFQAPKEWTQSNPKNQPNGNMGTGYSVRQPAAAAFSDCQGCRSSLQGPLTDARPVLFNWCINHDPQQSLSVPWCLFQV